MSYYVNETIRIIFTAIQYETSLSDVKMKVKKPDNSVEGLFTLIELLPDFPGTYLYDYIPDTKGHYLFEVNSVDNKSKFTKEYSVVNQPALQVKPFITFE